MLFKLLRQHILGVLAQHKEKGVSWSQKGRQWSQRRAQGFVQTGIATARALGRMPDVGRLKSVAKSAMTNAVRRLKKRMSAEKGVAARGFVFSVFWLGVGCMQLLAFNAIYAKNDLVQVVPQSVIEKWDKKPSSMPRSMLGQWRGAPAWIGSDTQWAEAVTEGWKKNKNPEDWKTLFLSCREQGQCLQESTTWKEAFEWFPWPRIWKGQQKASTKTFLKEHDIVRSNTPSDHGHPWGLFGAGAFFVGVMSLVNIVLSQKAYKSVVNSKTAATRVAKFYLHFKTLSAFWGVRGGLFFFGIGLMRSPRETSNALLGLLFVILWMMAFAAFPVVFNMLDQEPRESSIEKAEKALERGLSIAERQDLNKVVYRHRWWSRRSKQWGIKAAGPSKSRLRL